MTEQGSHDLLKCLSACASALQSEVIVKTGMNRVHATKNDRREWHGPPLRVNGEYAGINLSDLPRHLYGEAPMATAHRTEIWDVVVDEMFTLHKVVKLAKVYFPSIDFTSKPPTAALTQLLCALWWSGGELKVTKTDAFLKIGSRRLGLDQRIVTHHGQQRRLPPDCVINPSTHLTMPIGQAKVATSETTAVYRHLVVTLPELVEKLDVIFATAVTAGPEYQAAITNMFDVIEVDDIPATATVWAQARRIVNTAVETPTPELWRLLRGTLPYMAFTKMFGNPHRKNMSVYTAPLRKRHSASIDQFENGEINSAMFKKIGADLQAANNLLQLQSLMGPRQ